MSVTRLWREKPEQRAITWLVIGVCLVYISYIFLHNVTSQNFIKGDSYYYRAVIVSLLEDGDLLLANNIGDKNPLNGQLAVGRGGLVPKHPILMPVISLPFYMVGGSYGLLLFNLIDTFILLVLVFKLNRLFFEVNIACVITLLYAAGALFLNYSYNYSPDVFSTVLVLGALYAIWRNRFYFGVFLLGLSLFARVTNVVPAVLIGLYLIYVTLTQHQVLTRRVMMLIILGLIFLLALTPFFGVNDYLFGSILTTGYQQTALAGSDGQLLVVNHAGKFNHPLLTGIWQLLFAPVNGLILTNPVLILAFLGMLGLNRIQEKSKIYLLLAISLAQFIFFAVYDESLASHFSNRFLMTPVALSSVLAGNALTWGWYKLSPRRWTAMVAVVVSLLVGLNLFYDYPNLDSWPWEQRQPAMQTQIGANFGENLTLLGGDLYFDMTGSGQGSLAPVFYWQSRIDFQPPFELLLTLRRADTTQIVQAWRLPLNSAGPKSIWPANEIIPTVYRLETSAKFNTAYHLDIALQNPATGQFEPVKLANGSAASSFTLENIQDRVVVRLVKPGG